MWRLSRCSLATYLAAKTLDVAAPYRIALVTVTAPRPFTATAWGYSLPFRVFVFLSPTASTCVLPPSPHVLLPARLVIVAPT
ncbi:hypothetical protein R3P38DRAFT_3206228 [Favolaschia claudopus]|uniref:Secreted protein n=1 Tax=Favolaschia claudopus TaxID=2862362 RepID=A0AAW0AKN5_9AGAR